jgi:hypothetical protein
VVQCGVEFAGKPCEVLLKHLTRLYKLLGTAATGQLPQRGAGSGTASISGKFADLVAWVNQSCTPVVNDFITVSACPPAYPLSAACLPACLPEPACLPACLPAGACAALKRWAAAARTALDGWQSRGAAQQLSVSASAGSGRGKPGLS